MKLALFFLPLLLTLALSRAVSILQRVDFQKRDVTIILSDISTVSSQIVALNSTASSFNGGLFTLLKIQSQTKSLENGLSKAVEDVQTNAPFTDEESGSIATALLNLEPQIFSVLSTLKSKKTQFKNIGGLPVSVIFTVKQNLEEQQSLSAQLGDALVERFTPLFAGAAPRVNAAISATFSDAIQMFSTTTGIPLPFFGEWGSI